MEKKWTIQQPINGFLFPTFQDDCSDIHSVLYFAKKELHAEFITNGLTCELPLEESDQKEYFSSALSMAFPDDYTLEKAADVYKEVQKCIEEEQDLGKKELRNIMETCGAEEERLKGFDENYPEHLTLHPKNIIDEKNYVINGDGITLKVTADHMDLLEYKEIDGQSYLCIPVSAGLEKDDLPLKEKNCKKEKDS